MRISEQVRLRRASNKQKNMLLETVVSEPCPHQAQYCEQTPSRAFALSCPFARSTVRLRRAVTQTKKHAILRLRLKCRTLLFVLRLSAQYCLAIRSSCLADLNRRPPPYQGDALPAEPRQHHTTANITQPNPICKHYFPFFNKYQRCPP